MGLDFFKNGTNGKWPPREFQLKFKSSEVGTLRTVGLQRSSVQPTIAFSESISNVNISFCIERNIFDRLWERVACRDSYPMQTVMV
jgi:hypothetical protein